MGRINTYFQRDSYGGDTMMFDLFIDPTTNEVQIDTNINQKTFLMFYQNINGCI